MVGSESRPRFANGCLMTTPRSTLFAPYSEERYSGARYNPPRGVSRPKLARERWWPHRAGRGRVQPGHSGLAPRSRGYPMARILFTVMVSVAFAWSAAGGSAVPRALDAVVPVRARRPWRRPTSTATTTATATTTRGTVVVTRIR